MHVYDGRYYLSYSTGDTHRIVYATADDPYGPFTYRGVVLTPVLGWTTHHSILEFDGRWWLFYHDTSLSEGRTHLRSVKVTELTYRADGSIVTIDGRTGAPADSDAASAPGERDDDRSLAVVEPPAGRRGDGVDELDA